MTENIETAGKGRTFTQDRAAKRRLVIEQNLETLGMAVVAAHGNHKDCALDFTARFSPCAAGKSPAPQSVDNDGPDWSGRMAVATQRGIRFHPEGAACRGEAPPRPYVLVVYPHVIDGLGPRYTPCKLLALGLDY